MAVGVKQARRGVSLSRLVAVDASEVGLETVDELLVSVDLAGPASLLGVGPQGSDIGKLILKSRRELWGRDVVVAVFADVGVGARRRRRDVGCSSRAPLGS
jgi:hypothetical protein